MKMEQRGAMLCKLRNTRLPADLQACERLHRSSSQTHRAPALPAPYLGLLASRAEDEVALFKMPSLWYLVKAASKLAWGPLQPPLAPQHQAERPPSVDGHWPPLTAGIGEGD